jgi:hypothetical protein
VHICQPSGITLPLGISTAPQGGLRLFQRFKESLDHHASLLRNFSVTRSDLKTSGN